MARRLISYTLQIYFDFSGYSDMAIGLAAMFGFRFRENFNYPYTAQSITEFWRRWHISLSTWFRDYLYIPLGGNRCGQARLCFNMLIVFFLCGLWHGASWTFVLWGLYHGLFLAAERLLGGRRQEAGFSPWRWSYTLIAVMVGWIFFRADSLAGAGLMLQAMAGFGATVMTPWSRLAFLVQRAGDRLGSGRDRVFTGAANRRACPRMAGESGRSAAQGGMGRGTHSCHSSAPGTYVLICDVRRPPRGRDPQSIHLFPILRESIMSSE